MSAPRSLFALSALILLGTGSVAAQAAPRSCGDTVRANALDSSAARPDSAAVVLRGDTLLYLYGSVGPFSPEERARAALARIRELRLAGIDPDAVLSVTRGGHGRSRDESVHRVDHDGGRGVGGSRVSVSYAQPLAAPLRAALDAPRDSRPLRDPESDGRWYPRLHCLHDRLGGWRSRYSGLHQNVQDVFAERGIEILSPLYHAVCDGNLSTIPEPHAPSSADGAFRVTSVDS